MMLKIEIMITHSCWINSYKVACQIWLISQNLVLILEHRIEKKSWTQKQKKNEEKEIKGMELSTSDFLLFVDKLSALLKSKK